MKKLFFVLGLLSTYACKPAEVDIKSKNDDTGNVVIIEELAPIGVIPADDCRQIDIGDKPCNFRLSDQNGKTWDLYEHEGDVIVLDFSATWCYPCQIAGDHSQSIQDEFANDGVQMVTILIDGAIAGVEPTDQEIGTWVSSHNITTAPVLQGSREKMLDSQSGGVSDPGVAGYLLNAYPTYIYIGRDMKFYAGHVGFSEEYIRQKIQEGL